MKFESVMKLSFVCSLAAALPMMTASGASASSGHHRHLHHDQHISYRSDSSHRVADGRPAAWCGWEMRQLVGGNLGPEYNLARNWAHWGRPASGPAPGVIGVMPHHVFKVIEVLGHGTVLAISGNDSHAVRVRPRSTAGVIAWREG
jgi:hypothetical protein